MLHKKQGIFHAKPRNNPVAECSVYP